MEVDESDGWQRFRGLLEQRVRELEAEMQECRQVNLRLAELMDVVAELLLPAVQQDPARVDELLARYHASVGGLPPESPEGTGTS